MTFSVISNWVYRLELLRLEPFGKRHFYPSEFFYNQRPTTQNFKKFPSMVAKNKKAKIYAARI